MDITEINEYYEYAVQRSRRLQEFISELYTAWNDMASQTIQTRVLEPHKEDSERMLKAFREQCNAFQAILVKMRQVEEYERETHISEEAMCKEQEYARREIHEAEYMYDQFLSNDSIVRLQLPEVYRYIKSAKESI